MSDEEIEMVRGEEFAGLSTLEILQWALEKYSPEIALASSFQVEESVLIDLMHRLRGTDFRVFTLDTGRLNQETYECMDALRERYGVQIEVFFPDAGAVEKMVRSHGLNLFYQSIEMRKMCCNIRKVEPLKRALSGLSAWITGKPASSVNANERQICARPARRTMPPTIGTRSLSLSQR